MPVRFENVSNRREALLPAHRNGQPWSKEDLERLRQLARERRSVNAIADILERTPIGIRSKAISLGLRLGGASRTSPPQEPVSRDVAAKPLV